MSSSGDSDWVSAAVARVSHAAGSEGTWFRLVETLLQGLLALQEDYRAAEEADETLVRELRADVGREAGVLLEDCGDTQVSGDMADRLIELVAAHRARINTMPAPAVQAIVTAGIADAVDEALHPTFIARLRDEGFQQLEPGRAHLVHRYHPQNPHPLFQGPVNTNPARLVEGALDRTRHVRIAGQEALDHRFTLDWDAYYRLQALAEVKRLRVAACQPNVSLDEFDLSTSEGKDGRDGTFRNRGPCEPETQRDILLTLLDEAIRHEAHVVVFPEYTVHESAREALADRLEAAVTDGKTAPILVVAGTTAIETGTDTWENQACLLMPRGRPFHLRKCHAAVIDDHREDINTVPREVRVFMTDRFAVAVLICRDAMEPSICRTLGDIGINLCLVPAMSPVTSTLAQTVFPLAAATQAIVALANTPTAWPNSIESARALAGFHGPYEVHPSPLLLPTSQDQPWRERGLWLFDVYERRTRWIPVESNVFGNS